MSKFGAHAIYQGTVIHARHQPREHRFQYSLFQVLADLDDLDKLEQCSALWSVERFNLVQFRRADYLAGVDNLKQAVIDKIVQQSGNNFSGKVFLLTNLRYWGYCFNPVSFYFCYSDGKTLGEKPDYIVAEINNTPWNERHAYVLDINKATTSSHGDDAKTDTVIFEFDKVFHVSPFMPMDMHYRWLFELSPERMLIHMELYNTSEAQQSERQFFATMELSGQPLTRRLANRLPFSYPLLCVKVVAAIYWQALRLWLKRVPFFSHPDKLSRE